MEAKIFATCILMVQCHALPCIAMLYFGIGRSTVFATSNTLFQSLHSFCSFSVNAFSVVVSTAVGGVDPAPPSPW